MKIIVSAVACTPEGGSEGGVGWYAVLAIAKDHDVRVITQEMYRDAWDRAFSEKRVPAQVRVRFIDCGQSWHSNRMIAKLQSWTRYLKFSRKVLDVALRWHEEEPADLAHQVTYATWRVASPLWKMPIPSVWGPVGGAAVFPIRFFGILGWSSRAFECLRHVAGKLAEQNRKFRQCIENTSVVLGANQETRVFLSRFRKGRPLFELPVAYLTQEKIALFVKNFTMDSSDSGTLELFAGGNIEGRKGVSLALRAIEKLKKDGIEVRYTVAGGGPEISTLKKLSTQLGIDDRVVFHPGYQGQDYIRKLKESDIYFLPSFRETTPVTLLEAALAGCVPVVADASAAGEMSRLIGGDSIPAGTPDELVQGLADAVSRLHGDRSLLQKRSIAVSKAAADRYSEERYREVIRNAYQAAIPSEI